MSNVFLLLKIYIKQFIGSFNRSKNKKSQLSAIIFGAIIGFTFIFAFTSMAYGTVSEAIKVGMPELAIYIQGATCLMFAFLMVVLKCTKVKRSNDANLLLSLPFTKTEIIFSKVLSNIILDFLTIFLTIVPGFIVYYILVPDASFSMILWSILISILITLFATGLSSLLKHLVYVITRHMKHAEIFQTVISTVFTVIFFVVYFLINQAMYNIDTGVENIFYSFPPLKWIVDLTLKNNLLYLLFIALCTLIPFIVSIIIEAKVYGKEVSFYKTTNKELSFKQLSPSKRLFKKEFLFYLRTPIYVLNTIIGGLMLILMGFLLLFIGKDYIINMLKAFNMNLDESQINVLIVILLSLIASTIITTSSSISLEGKYLWILKVNPVKEKAIFNSKIAVNLVIGIIPIILCSVLTSISIGVIYLPFLLIILFLSVFISSIIGLLVNLHFPKLEWKDESEPIKQGMSGLISFAIAIIPSFILFLSYFLFFSKVLSSYIFLGIVILLQIILVLILYKVLLSKGKSLFQKL